MVSTPSSFSALTSNLFPEICFNLYTSLFKKESPKHDLHAQGEYPVFTRSQYLCQQPDLSMSSPEFRDKPLYIHKLCTTPCLRICVKRKLIISVKKYLVNVEFLILFNLSHMIFHSSDYCIQNHHYKIGKNNTGSRRGCRHIRKGHTRDQTHH